MPDTTWREGLALYLERYSALYHTGETPQQFRMTGARFAEFVGQKPLCAITPSDVQAYMLWRRNAGIGVATVNSELSRLRAVFAWMTADGLVASSPAQRVKRLRWIREDLSARVNEGQLAILLLWLQKHQPMYYELAMVILNLGLRVSEALRLLGSDVDIVRLRIRVVSHKSARIDYVGINDELAPILAKLKLAAGDGPLFPKERNRGGPVYKRRTITRRFAKFKAQAGVPELSLGFLRHVTATINARVMPEHMLTQLMRHRNPSVTAQYYIHLRHVTPKNIGAKSQQQ